MRDWGCVVWVCVRPPVPGWRRVADLVAVDLEVQTLLEVAVDPNSAGGDERVGRGDDVSEVAYGGRPFL